MIRSGPLLQAPLDQRARGQHDLALELLGLEVAGPVLLHAEHVAQHRRDGLRHLGAGLRATAGPPPASVGRHRASRPVPPDRLRGRAPRRPRRWARPGTSRRRGGRWCRRVGHRPRAAPGTQRSAATCPCPPRRPGSRPGLGPAASGRTRRGAARARPTRPTIGAASPWAASPRADPGSASAPSRRWTTIGSALPRSVNSPAGSKAKRCRVSAWVAVGDQDRSRTLPRRAGGRPCSRCRPSRRRPPAAPASPRLPATTGPVWTAMCKRHRLAKTRGPRVAQCRAARQHVERGVERPLRIVLVRDRRAEHGQDGIADEFRPRSRRGE